MPLKIEKATNYQNTSLYTKKPSQKSGFGRTAYLGSYFLLTKNCKTTSTSLAPHMHGSQCKVEINYALLTRTL
jgi:hypothetical protein